jgi:hypothetical protein
MFFGLQGRSSISSGEEERDSTAEDGLARRVELWKAWGIWAIRRSTSNWLSFPRKPTR